MTQSSIVPEFGFEPMHIGVGWFWLRAVYADYHVSASCLPPGVFSRLVGGQKRTATTRYGSREEAMTALNLVLAEGV